MSILHTGIAFGIIVALAQVVVAAPHDPTPEARAVFSDKKYDEAAKKLEPYVASNRFDGRAWSLYCECLHFSKQYEKAIEAGMSALECGSNIPGQSYNI